MPPTPNDPHAGMVQNVFGDWVSNPKPTPQAKAAIAPRPPQVVRPGVGMIYPNPLDQPDAWGVFVLANQPSPGVARVSGAGAPRKLDVKEGHGTSGATVTYAGDKVSKFSVTIELLETEDWQAWWNWRSLLEKPPKGAQAAALACSHPALDPLGITACLVEEEHQPEPSGDDGLWTVKVDFIQYQKPTPALGTPKGSAFVGVGASASSGGLLGALEGQRNKVQADLIAQQQGLAGGSSP